MWINRTKGFIEGLDDNTSWFYMDDITFDGGSDDQIFKVVNGAYEAYTYEVGYVDIDYDLDFQVVPGGSGDYDIVIYNQNNSVVLLQSNGESGTQTFSVNIDTAHYQYTKPSIKIVSEGTITSLDVTISGTKTVVGGVAPGTYTGGYTWAQVVPNTEINIPSVIPKMTVMQFFSGIFKMFNLTHYKKSDGEIYVDTLDNFYALGRNIEVTDKIDVTDSVVKIHSHLTIYPLNTLNLKRF